MIWEVDELKLSLLLKQKPSKRVEVVFDEAGSIQASFFADLNKETFYHVDVTDKAKSIAVALISPILCKITISLW